MENKTLIGFGNDFSGRGIGNGVTDFVDGIKGGVGEEMNGGELEGVGNTSGPRGMELKVIIKGYFAGKCRLEVGELGDGG